MTRARDRLIVCGHWDGRYPQDGAAPDAWHPLVGDAMRRIGSEIETGFGKGYALGAEQTARTAAGAVLTCTTLPEWARTPLKRRAGAASVAPSGLKGEPPVFSPLREDTKRYRRGLLIHGLLERLPELARADRGEGARAWLKRQGAEGGEADALAAEAIAVVEDPAFAALFGADSRAEAPIVGVVRGRPVRGIVDRLVVRPDSVEILDFKSDRPAPVDPADAPESYVLQMALYREVLGAIFPKRTIGCALLWTEKPALTRLAPERMRDALDAFFAVEAA
jgi:ATP-dependent helicase/nuclease subunit A